MQDYRLSAIERLANTSDVMEVWWDSSPLIYKAWAEEVIKNEKDDYRDTLKFQLSRLFNYDKPEETVFSGVTTNPRLTSRVLELIPEEVNPIIDKIIKENPYKSDYEIAWEVYKAITKEGAKLYMPLFESSKYKKGYVSAQVDPRLVTNTREMLLQALELKKQSENIIVKCPGS